MSNCRIGNISFWIPRFVRFARNVIPTLAALAASPNLAIAEINGLAPFTLRRNDSGAPPVLVDADTIELTTGSSQQRSLWFNAPQNISVGFEATFSYRATTIGATASRQGIAFVIHNDADGLNTLGGPPLGGFGYVGIQPSAAVTIETDTGPARTFTGQSANGVLGSGSVPTFPVNAFSGQAIDVKITYDGIEHLAVSMTDGTNVFPTRNYIVGSLEDIVGGDDAFIGFTASTGGGGARQFISNFHFANVPEPSSTLTLAIGTVAVAATCLARTRRAARHLGNLPPSKELPA